MDIFILATTLGILQLLALICQAVYVIATGMMAISMCNLIANLIAFQNTTKEQYCLRLAIGIVVLKTQATMNKYYGVLPAKVRHSKISAGAKLLYTELTAQPNNGTFTEATNVELAAALGVDKGTVSKWLGELKEAQFILLVVFKDEGNRREIYPLHGLRIANVIGAMMQAFTNIQ